MLRQWCLNCSAVFLLWGSASFLGTAANQRLIALFAGFLFTWSYVEFFHVHDHLWGSVPVFGLMGVASMVSAGAFFKLRRRTCFVGVGPAGLGVRFVGILLDGLPVCRGQPAAAGGRVLYLRRPATAHRGEHDRAGAGGGAAFQPENRRKNWTRATVEKDRLATKVNLAEERYRTLFQQAQEGIVLVNATDLRIVDWNPAAQRLLGIAPGSTETHLISDFLVLPQGGRRSGGLICSAEAPKSPCGVWTGEPSWWI